MELLQDARQLSRLMAMNSEERVETSQKVTGGGDIHGYYGNHKFILNKLDFSGIFERLSSSLHLVRRFLFLITAYTTMTALSGSCFGANTYMYIAT